MLKLDQGGEARQNRMMEIESKRVELLGVGISEINLESATEQILERLGNKQKGYICVTGVHGVIEAQDDSKFRTILNRSFLTTPDGMPMVWVSWALLNYTSALTSPPQSPPQCPPAD